MARELGINDGTLDNWCAVERRRREGESLRVNTVHFSDAANVQHSSAADSVIGHAAEGAQRSGLEGEYSAALTDANASTSQWPSTSISVALRNANIHPSPLSCASIRSIYTLL